MGIQAYRPKMILLPAFREQGAKNLVVVYLGISFVKF